jgi:hypothetical protein
MSTTSKGAPYPAATDPNDVAGDLQALAEWVDAHPGTSVYTTAQRDVLVGADIWAGRVIFNSTTGLLEQNKTGVAGAGNWSPIAPADAAAATASLRTLGTGAQQAAGGNHKHATADTTSGTFDIARLPVAASGTSSATALVRADDTRLSNARPPTAHTHNFQDLGSTGSPIGLGGAPLVLSDAANYEQTYATNVKTVQRIVNEQFSDEGNGGGWLDLRNNNNTLPFNSFGRSARAASSGPLTRVQGRLKVTNAAFGDNSYWVLNLPDTTDSSGAAIVMHYADVAYWDASAGALYRGMVVYDPLNDIPSNSPQAKLFVYTGAAGGALVAVTPQVPFAWAVDDVIIVNADLANGWAPAAAGS